MRHNPENKEAIVSFRATNLERIQLEMKALKKNMNLSQYLRTITLKK